MGIIKFIKKAIKYLYRETVLYAIWHFSSYFPLFPTFMLSKFRPISWRWLGAEIGKGCFIGYGIFFEQSAQIFSPLLIGNIIHEQIINTSKTCICFHKIPSFPLCSYNIF